MRMQKPYAVFHAKQSGYQNNRCFFSLNEIPTEKTSQTNAFIIWEKPTRQPILCDVETKYVMKRRKKKFASNFISILFIVLYNRLRLIGTKKAPRQRNIYKHIIDRIQAIHSMTEKKWFGVYCLFRWKWSHFKRSTCEWHITVAPNSLAFNVKTGTDTHAQ